MSVLIYIVREISFISIPCITNHAESPQFQLNSGHPPQLLNQFKLLTFSAVLTNLAQIVSTNEHEFRSNYQVG
jgi:hypothetical protein